MKSQLKCVSKKGNIQIILDTHTKAEFVIFHIFNFYDFKDFNKNIPYKGAGVSGGYTISEDTFETQDYNITIQSLKETNRNIKEINEKGISRLTHVAKVEKKDKGFISVEEYKKLQKLLTCFFSFSKGSWINPSCPIGIDANAEKAWYLLNAPKSEWKSLESWFKPTYNQPSMPTMKKLFLQFSELWKIEDWRETLWEVIYWFINANDGARGVDAGLILAQTALERLSFEYVVNDKKLLSNKGFKDIWASDKFRLLFSSLNIPLEIPSELKTLTKEAKSHNWLDAPHALTEIRNSLVHPEHKKHGKFGIAAYSEAHTLSLWYLEISILAICKYDDVYANRVKNSKIENVPYIKEQS